MLRSPRATRRVELSAGGSSGLRLRVPDEFPLFVFSVTLVKLDGLPVDLAPYSDQVSTKYLALNGPSTGSAPGLRCGDGGRDRIRGVPTLFIGLRILIPGGVCNGGLRWGRDGSRSDRLIGRGSRLAGLLKPCHRKTGARNAADQLTRGSHVDQAEFSLVAIHRIFVGLAEKMNPVLRFGEVVERLGESAQFAVIQTDAAHVLFAAPDQLFFLFAPALGDQNRRRQGRGDGHQSNKKYHHQECVAGIALRPAAMMASAHCWLIPGLVHPCGGCAGRSSGSVLWRPVPSSSKSAVVLPMRTRR